LLGSRRQEFTEFPLPTSISSPSSITVGPDGALWFRESFGQKVARITTGGVITESRAFANSGPEGITTGPDGNIWFADFSGNRIRVVRLA